jgi:RNA recognition motif-containing protein
MGYVRNVTEGVKAEELRAALSSFGELVYFDINRQKNCAFVEFATTAGYQAAFAASPHQVGGESIVVEPRRPKSSAYGGSGYSARGGVSGRGRGGFENRGPGGQRGRGGFGGAARGGGGAPRGRGQAAPTTA